MTLFNFIVYMLSNVERSVLDLFSGITAAFYGETSENYKKKKG
jgi:hypothetical protein